jgi:methionine synthase II (cobalamin-independent)
MVAFTGIGSLPGTDFGAAVRMTFDKVVDFPYLPELPARGPWAAMIGRGLGLPSGLPADFSAGEWRLADAPGSEQRRSRALWREDLDRLEEETQGFVGPFKVAVTGPWTLAAALGVAHTGRVLADQGARRDLTQSLAESVAELLGELRRRLPGAELVLQVDEPSLPAVAAGAVPTPGGFFRHRAIDLPEIATGLGQVTAAAKRVGGVTEVLLHSCAAWVGPGRGWPVEDLLSERGAGFAAMSLDIDTLASADLDALGAAADAGRRLYLGVLATNTEPLAADPLTTRVMRFIERIGQPESSAIVLTPACGMAAWTPAQVSAGLAVLKTVSVRASEELGAS